MSKNRGIRVLLVVGFLLAILILVYIDKSESESSNFLYEFNQNLDFAGTNSNIDQAYLYTTGSIEGFGIAKRIKTENGHALSIRANLPNLLENEKYIGWVSKDDGNGKMTYLSLGILAYGENEYFLIYQSINNLSEFKGILITKANNTTDLNLPENSVLEGQF